MVVSFVKTIKLLGSARANLEPCGYMYDDSTASAGALHDNAFVHI